MAHSCPDCGSTCYCCGDIDDIDFGEYFAGCTCCMESGKENDGCREYYDDDYEDESAADDAGQMAELERPFGLDGKQEAARMIEGMKDIDEGEESE